MSDAIWKQGRETKDWFCEYRGLTVRITVGPNDTPTEISWYAEGRQMETVPVQCTIELCKVIGCAVIDCQITDGIWAWASARAE